MTTLELFTKVYFEASRLLSTVVPGANFVNLNLRFLSFIRRLEFGFLTAKSYGSAEN